MKEYKKIRGLISKEKFFTAETRLNIPYYALEDLYARAIRISIAEEFCMTCKKFKIDKVFCNLISDKNNVELRTCIHYEELETSK